MDSDTFDLLTRQCDPSRTRRSALIMLLGAATGLISLGRVEAKPEPNGRGTVKRTVNGKGKSDGRGKHRRKGRGRVGAEADAKKAKPGNHCISPSGNDLNELLGISDQIVAPFCNVVGSGEKWVNTQPWIMEPIFKDAPEGFVPAGDTPLEDFLAKFEGVRYAIDTGSRQEQSVFIPTSDELFIDVDDGFDVVSPGTLGSVHPLRVGRHVFDLYWVFNDLHCDGFEDSVIELNCFPAGETRYVEGLAFEVVPGHN